MLFSNLKLNSQHYFVISILTCIIQSSPAFARPEYAVKEKLNCVSCHVTPWGGGPRTVLGKTYGSHSHTPAKTSNSDLYYASVRFIDYYATSQTSQRPSGSAVMEAAVTGNAPIIQNEDQSETRGVLTFNIPTIGNPSLREAYIRWNLGTQTSIPPYSIVLGRFYVPFGLLTDEHRAYTRIQTNMTFNHFDMGAVLSGNPSESFHLDVALVNDFQTGGTFSTNTLPWGIVFNGRWNPPSLPFFLGVSTNYQHILNAPQPYAGSAYTALSLDRLTNSGLSGSILLEGVLAKNWNSPKVNTGLVNLSLSQFFIPSENTDYLSSVQEATSLGWYGQFKYNLTSVWTLLYRFDYLALNTNNYGANYTRNGIGFEAYLNSNLIWTTRYEIASVPNFIASKSNSTQSAQNTLFTILRLWL